MFLITSLRLPALNGFADVMIPLGDLASVTLRGGRQELIFGSQRLVGPGDFTQVPHTFDGDPPPRSDPVPSAVFLLARIRSRCHLQQGEPRTPAGDADHP